MLRAELIGRAAKHSLRYRLAAQLASPSAPLPEPDGGFAERLDETGVAGEDLDDEDLLKELEGM